MKALDWLRVCPWIRTNLLPIYTKLCIPITITAAVAKGCAHRDAVSTGTHSGVIKDRPRVICGARDLMQITVVVITRIMRDGFAMFCHDRGTLWQAEGEIDARSTIISTTARSASI
jgi:hypothetical protein